MKFVVEDFIEECVEMFVGMFVGMFVEIIHHQFVVKNVVKNVVKEFVEDVFQFVCWRCDEEMLKYVVEVDKELYHDLLKWMWMNVVE